MVVTVHLYIGRTDVHLVASSLRQDISLNGTVLITFYNVNKKYNFLLKMCHYLIPVSNDNAFVFHCEYNCQTLPSNHLSD